MPSDYSQKLKNSLEEKFSMAFKVVSSREDGEYRYLCSPENEGNIYFNVLIYIHNNIRLIVNIAPQRHGRYIINEMSGTADYKRVQFFQYIEYLRERGAKVNFLVNNTNLTGVDSWPTQWETFDCKIQISPIPDYEDGVSDYSILSEWSQLSFELIFSLLTISDVSDEVLLEQVHQGEGTVHEIKSIRYERNNINRRLCIYKKGYTCSVCGMDFFHTYGPIGKDYIEIHHTTPVSQMGPDYILDIERDLVPLCSNCHSMAHRRNPPYTIDELKKFIETQKDSSNNLSP